MLDSSVHSDHAASAIIKKQKSELIILAGQVKKKSTKSGEKTKKIKKKLNKKILFVEDDLRLFEVNDSFIDAQEYDPI